MPNYIPGVSLERVHELVRQKINQDPSLTSLTDVLDPSANVITVTGMRCVGVPIGTPDFVHAYVRAKAVEIGKDVHKSSASSRILKFTTICCAFANTRAWSFLVAICLLRS